MSNMVIIADIALVVYTADVSRVNEMEFPESNNSANR